jgi:mevalonate kinase
MRSVEAIVPLKLTLFGEHAVVYGYPAIAMAISETMKVRVEKSDKTIVSSNTLTIGNIKVDLDEMRAESSQLNRVLSYVIAALNYFQDRRPVHVSVESTVEPSVGLGTSAAVIVGVVASYSRYIGLNYSPEEIAKISREIERSVQGLGSRMDTYTTSLGGLLYFPRNSDDVMRINGNLQIAAGYIRRATSTAEILRRVKGLRDRGHIVDKIMDVIGEVTELARKALESGDDSLLGELMYVNHGLLSSLGVSHPTIDELVSTARSLGMKGCKMSGGGGGGSVICVREPKSEILLESKGLKIVNSEINSTGVTTKEIN